MTIANYFRAALITGAALLSAVAVTTIAPQDAQADGYYGHGHGRRGYYGRGRGHHGYYRGGGPGVVFVAPRPVYVEPAPVYVQPPQPVYVQPPTVVIQPGFHHFR